MPSTRPGNLAASPLVAPFVPPVSLCTSSPSTTIRSSAAIAASITRQTASMNFPRLSSPVKAFSSTERAPAISAVSPRIPTSTKAGSGHSSGRIRRVPALTALGSGPTRAPAAFCMAACACRRTDWMPASSMSPSLPISAATRSSGSRARQAASSSRVR